MRTTILFIFYCCVSCSFVLSHELHLQLVEYNHTSDTLVDGLRKCDVDSACDPTFIICLSRFKADKRCTLLSATTPPRHFIDRTHIVFDTYFGDQKNMFTASLPDIQPITLKPHLKVIVHDDDNSRKYIAFLNTVLPEPGEYTLIDDSSTPSASLKVRFWYTCSLNWYGKKCDKLCSPMRQRSKNFGCDMSTGESVCEKGFRKSSSDNNVCEKDPCSFPSPCQFASECHPVSPTVEDERNYRCTCPVHLKGRHCEDVKFPCSTDFCSNGGKCWMDSKNVSHCQCPPAFTGSHCEEVAYKDEGSISTKCGTDKAPVCLNGGKCIRRPLLTSDTCFCQKGFGGDRCELNVTWGPSYSEMVLWRDITRRYIDVVPVIKARPTESIISAAPLNVPKIQIRNKKMDTAQYHSMYSTAPAVLALHGPVSMLQNTHYSISKVHFGLIAMALACLAVIVLSAALTLVYRRKLKFKIFRDDISQYPPPAPELYDDGPVRYVPSKGAVSTSKDSFSYRLSSQILEDDYLTPGTVYEAVDEI